MTPDALVRSYKDLAGIERAFRSLKKVHLEVRPLHHRLEERVKAHVFICMLAYYVLWHVRRALAPLLFDDEDLEGDRKRRSAVAPAQRSANGQRKAATKRTADGFPVHSTETLLKDLATLTKNRMRFGEAAFDQVASPRRCRSGPSNFSGSPGATNCSQSLDTWIQPQTLNTQLLNDRHAYRTSVQPRPTFRILGKVRSRSRQSPAACNRPRSSNAPRLRSPRVCNRRELPICRSLQIPQAFNVPAHTSNGPAHTSQMPQPTPQMPQPTSQMPQPTPQMSQPK